MEKKSIINCHAHIFTGDNVAPYLAKKFVPFPFYYLFNLQWLVCFFRWWNKLYNKLTHNPFMIRLAIVKNRVRIFVDKFGIFKTIFTWAVTLEVLLIILRWIIGIQFIGKINFLNLVKGFLHWATIHKLVVDESKLSLEIGLIIFLILFLPSGRNFIVFVIKKLVSILGSFTGKNTKELLRRYMNIGRYAFYKESNRIYARLKDQYPPGTGIVALPMDMEFMGAGKVQCNYQSQMEALASIKKNNTETFFPFVFIDPRRFEMDATHFVYTVENGKVILGNCFIKEYIESKKFSGFKIYPALGYYPFDEALLPLWKYAADHQIPITTHCIKGIIFYRGKKKEEWNRHPVFQQTNGHQQYEPLLLPEMDNIDFSANFTHPLNYLCLLNETLLRKLVSKANKNIQQLFGYTNDETELKHNLSHLKINLAHYGGDEEWVKYYEADRDSYSSQIIKLPKEGIDFFKDVNDKPAPGKLEQLWKTTDWYSIISSIMIQYKNVYADISYILHNDALVLPLLKETLRRDEIKKQVLFGTDFFVVRNHKSDKQMLADLMGGLSEEEFDVIARENPRIFLNIATGN